MKILRFGHSPDVDDAYMLYGLATGRVSIPGYEVHHIIDEIDVLNQRACSSELEISAISAHAYPFVADTYAIMATGASVARGYGPVVISKAPIAIAALEGARVAVPGRLTTAHLLAQVLLPPFRSCFISFRDVERALRDDEVDAAIVIHEGQMLWRERGHHLVVDLGRMFTDITNRPVPLGLDVVRRDLGVHLGIAVRQALLASILAAQANHAAAVDHAANFGRGLRREEVERFVQMYVNADTLELPDDAAQGLRELYLMAVSRGLIAAVPPLDILR
jgi:1,4-dihydroxy-6-naphthoate synthase